MDPKTRVQCRQKIAQLEAKLEEIEQLKAQEPQLRRDLAAQRDKLARMPHEGDEDELEEEEPEQPQQTEAADEGVDVQKRLKAINKKLKQIAELKAKGGVLEPEAAAKVASEGTLLRELAVLKDGKVFTEELDAEMKSQYIHHKVLLPKEPAEREKRLKALNKKLGQIAELKKKGGTLDNEAKAKVASEYEVKQEIAALESGASEVVFSGPSQDDLIQEASNKKIEVEKKIKAARKKLAAIDALKSKGGNLPADEKAKVDSEGGLKKELGALERELGALNKAERERVSQRVG